MIPLNVSEFCLSVNSLSNWIKLLGVNILEIVCYLVNMFSL